MSTALQAQDNKAEALERAMLIGDLSKLSPDERLFYYKNVCESLGLNPMTRPFEYMSTDGKLSLYARKEAAAQLAAKHGVSIGKPDLQFAEGLCIVSVTATNAAGRTDSDIGAVALENLKGTARANAIMKAITKAKRRVTLSICGLGMLDETEVSDIRGAQIVPIEQPALPDLDDADLDKYGELVKQTEQVQAMTPEEFAKTASDIFDAELGESQPADEYADPDWLERQIHGVQDLKHRRMLAELYADAYEQYECRPMVLWAFSKVAINDVEFLAFLREHKFSKGAFLEVFGNWVETQNGVAQ